MSSENCICIRDDRFIFSLRYEKDYLIYSDHSSWVGLNKADIEKSCREKDTKLEISNLSDGVFRGDLKDPSVVTKTFAATSLGNTLIKYSELPVACSVDKCNFDGVYKFQIKVCNNEQVYYKTEAILVSVFKVYKEMIREEMWEEAKEVFRLMEYIKAFASAGDIKKATKHYKILIRFIKKSKCNCNGIMFL